METRTETSLFDAALACWALPITLSAQWCAMLDAAARANARVQAPHPPEEDLHVPDPIEDAGERALFA